MYNQTLMYDFEAKKIDKEYIENFQEKVFSTIEHMNSTLNDFRTFFRPNKEIKEFCLNDCIKNVCLFVKDEFIKEQINITINIPENLYFFAIEAEFKHIILNIINNSKDAFLQNKIQNKKIVINAFKEDTTTIIEISDNAGGIPEDHLNKIFKANFTTKKENGSGIGLYMSSLIAQKNQIELNVKNIDNGSMFILKK
jgi:signal transduction histidine kinase